MTFFLLKLGQITRTKVKEDILHVNVQILVNSVSVQYKEYVIPERNIVVYCYLIN